MLDDIPAEGKHMIKTWRQRCEEHPDHDGIVSEAMIQARMQEEIDELRAAIEQAQEPVAWISEGGDVSRSKRYMDQMGFKCNPLYTAPRQWQGLTDEEVVAVYGDDLKYQDGDYRRYARAIEAKLKERNT